MPVAGASRKCCSLWLGRHRHGSTSWCAKPVCVNSRRHQCTGLRCLAPHLVMPSPQVCRKAHGSDRGHLDPSNRTNPCIGSTPRMLALSSFREPGGVLKVVSCRAAEAPLSLKIFQPVPVHTRGPCLTGIASIELCGQALALLTSLTGSSRAISCTA